MFAGSYTYSLDSAGRFVMPRRFRNLLGDDFLITAGLGCLWVFTRDYFDRQLRPGLDDLCDSLQSLLQRDRLRLTRHFFRYLTPTNADGQNRVPLSPELRRYAGIEDTLVVCGCNNYVELWAPAALEEDERQNDKADDIIAAAESVFERSGCGSPGDQQDAGVSRSGSDR